jgi:S1-C subfamily serine protease
MKYIIYLLAILYFIWWIYIINVFFTSPKIDISTIEKSIVIIIPEKKLISYKNNPKWLFEENKTSWIWAWFIIDNSWTIQTVNHIVENDKINYKIIYNNKEYDSIILSRNKEKDLAKIKIKSDNDLKYLPLTNINNYINNDEILSFWIDTKTMKIVSNTWIIINKKSKLGSMSNLLQISNSLKPGFSWWPIINSKWKVIWINYAISNWKNYGINY